MSNQTVLLNISEEAPYLNGFCDLKCDLSFYYQSSNCTIAPTDSNNILHYFYENTSNGIPQVLYNGIEYNVSGVSIVLSSFHFFDGNLAEAEIHIIHQPVLGNGLPLAICIPITSSRGSIPNNKGTKVIEQMIISGIEAVNLNDNRQTTIDDTISNINSSMSNLDSGTSQIIGELPKTNKKRNDSQGNNIRNDEGNIQTNLSYLSEQLKNDYFDRALSVNMRNITYTLESIIPVKRPFFSYTNTNDNTYMVVYGMNDAIFVDPSVIQSLQTAINPIYTDTNATYNNTLVASNSSANPYPLFLNKTGATSLLTNNLSDEIYIDCQPTGSSTEQTNLTTATNEPSKTSSVKFFIYVMFFILVLVVIYMLFAYITHPDKKNFSVRNIKNPFV